MIVGTYGHGLYELDPRNEFSLAKRISFKGSEVKTSTFITSIVKDSKENFWVGTDANGIILLNSNYKLIAHYKHEPQNNKSLASNRVRTLFFDTDKTLWVGT